MKQDFLEEDDSVDYSELKEAPGTHEAVQAVECVADGTIYELNQETETRT